MEHTGPGLHDSVLEGQVVLLEVLMCELCALGKLAIDKSVSEEEAQTLLQTVGKDPTTVSHWPWIEEEHKVRVFLLGNIWVSFHHKDFFFVMALCLIHLSSH